MFSAVFPSCLPDDTTRKGVVYSEPWYVRIYNFLLFYGDSQLRDCFEFLEVLNFSTVLKMMALETFEDELNAF